MPSVQSQCKVAWLFPSLARGYYWHPVLAELAKKYPEMVTFTGHWTGYAKNYDKAFAVEEVGKTTFLQFNMAASGYNRGIIVLSLRIIPRLLGLRPQVIMTVAFSAWTALVLLLKPMAKWKIVIVYDGDSPNIGGTASRPFRTLWRSVIARFCDAFITNSQAGRTYLIQQLGVSKEMVFAKPYEIPDPALSAGVIDNQFTLSHWNHYSCPIFLFVGQLVKRKGVAYLLEACQLLKKKGCHRWKLIIVGDGPIRIELEELSRSNGLEGSVHWEGWVQNEFLGQYYEASDVFVFPTLEDIWGMTVLEAMLFQMPIFCSKWAGVVEMMEEGRNGYIFDPYLPLQLAELMKTVIDKPELVETMGARSRQIISSHTPERAAEHLIKIVELMVSNEKNEKTRSVMR